jgi:hypothetical protein
MPSIKFHLEYLWELNWQSKSIWCRIVEDLILAHNAANFSLEIDDDDEDPVLKALSDKSKLAIRKLVRSHPYSITRLSGRAKYLYLISAGKCLAGYGRDFHQRHSFLKSLLWLASCLANHGT